MEENEFEHVIYITSAILFKPLKRVRYIIKITQHKLLTRIANIVQVNCFTQLHANLCASEKTYMCTHILYMLLKSGIILCMHSANERWRYIVTSSLIGWAHTQNEHAERIEASTRWSPLHNFRFQIHFFDWKIMHFDSSRLRHDMEKISTLRREESRGFSYQRISNVELWCLLCC